MTLAICQFIMASVLEILNLGERGANDGILRTYYIETTLSVAMNAHKQNRYILQTSEPEMCALARSLDRSSM